MSTAMDDHDVKMKPVAERQIAAGPMSIDATNLSDGPGSTASTVGMWVFFLDAIVLCLILGQLLHQFAAPLGNDPEWLSLLICHTVVAALLVATRLSMMMFDDGSTDIYHVYRWDVEESH